MPNENKDNRLVDMASWILQNLELVVPEKLNNNNCYQEAARVNTARVTAHQLCRELRAHEHTLQAAEAKVRRFEFLLRKLFEADEKYGTGFENTDAWNEAYEALRSEIK